MKRSSVISVLVAAALSLGGCSGGADPGEYTFNNGGFENGSLSGWTADGDAFGEKSVSRLTVSECGDTFYQQGKYFLYGGAVDGKATGTLTSEAFKLKGNGRIGFLIGVGADPDKCYVALCDADGKELVKAGNERFGASGFTDDMYRVVLDGSDYVGKKVRIKIVDNDSGEGMQNYINVDDFIVNYGGEAEIPGKTLAADKYISQMSQAVDTTYRHTYHVMPPVGWMNDPNGFNYAFGKYHFFYQFHPYSAEWGPMHWGHYTTEDFVKWSLEPTAIAPDTDYDRDGCFSGTSIVKDGRMYLMYTSVADGRQTQALARSTDGVHFTKAGEVITSEELPADCSWADFRDPKVFYRGDSYYALMGSRGTDGSGQVLMYKSADLMRWRYVGKVWKDRRTNGVYECPDLVNIGGADVFITSPQGFARDDWRHENVHGNLYMTGKLNTDTGAFEALYEDEIDSGFDFYAPQTLTAPDGRVIMTAWMQMWTRSMPAAAHGWAGAAILPRELSLKNGRLYQTPVREIEKYRRNKMTAENREIDGKITLDGVSGTKAELVVSLDLGSAAKAGIKVYCGTRHETLIYYDRAADKVVFDRSNMGTTISHDAKELNASKRSAKVTIENNTLKIRIFLDVSSCEVFFNDGERVMTGNVYSDAGDTGISFFTENGTAKIVSLEKYDIVVG